MGWTQEQSINFECAREVINDLMAIYTAKIYLITTMIQPFRTTLKGFCSGGLNHGQKQGSISKKHEHSYLYSALWR